MVYEAGWMLTTTTTVKIFIDVFIGIWAVLLSAIWAYKIDPKPGEKIPLGEIAGRFPKFVLGYFLLFLLLLGAALAWPGAARQLKAATGEADLFRDLFFVMTFFTIGLGPTSRSSGPRGSAGWPSFTCSACSASSSGSAWRSRGSFSTAFYPPTVGGG